MGPFCVSSSPPPPRTSTWPNGIVVRCVFNLISHSSGKTARFWTVLGFAWTALESDRPKAGGNLGART